MLHGWGGTAPSRAHVVHPGTLEELAAVVADAGPRGVLVRGAGRSYGDAAQNGGGTVLDLSAFSSVRVLDDGDVVAGAGAVLAHLVPVLLRRGRFLPVTPGTRYVTVGGAVAADVHGKNHHVDSSFGAHVRRLDLLTADGTLRRLCRDGSPAEQRLLDATLGGMGLTGAVTEVQFGTVPAPTASILVDTHRADDLDTVMALMAEGDDRHRYSVAWVDGTVAGARLGRGVVTFGDHAPEGDGDPRHRTPPPGEPRVGVPPLPVSPLHRHAVAAFNEAWFRRAPRRRIAEPTPLAPFFYPLDAVGGWNRLYGPSGFLQYQFAVPDSGAAMVRRTLEQLRALRVPAYLTVLKRFGPGRDASPLSFPMAGWTLAVDVPARDAALARALDRLDEQVLEAGGRLYLAKDSRAVPATIAAGYPQLDRFRAVRRDVDPDGVFVSDLARRLDL
ncbi:MAG: FAD-binding protein [Frankiales bacterium]|nr:FAD-binding protein [Frankiales bacterium]